MQRAPVTSFQEASTESCVVIEKHREFFPRKVRTRAACCTSLANQPFFFLRRPLFFFPYFFTFQCAPLLLFSNRLPSRHCAPAIKGFTRTNRPCSPRGSSWNSIFFSTLAGRRRRRRASSWIGAVCALFLSSSLLTFEWKVDRIPEEIEWKSRRARRCNSEAT